MGPIVDQAKSFSQDFMSAEEPSSLPDDYVSQIKECLIPQDSEDLMLALTHLPMLM